MVGKRVRRDAGRSSSGADDVDERDLVGEFLVEFAWAWSRLSERKCYIARSTATRRRRVKSRTFASSACGVNWRRHGSKPTIEEDVGGADSARQPVGPEESVSNVGDKCNRECGLKSADRVYFGKQLEDLKQIAERIGRVSSLHSESVSLSAVGRSDAGSTDDRATTAGSLRAASLAGRSIWVVREPCDRGVGAQAEGAPVLGGEGRSEGGREGLPVAKGALFAGGDGGVDGR